MTLAEMKRTIKKYGLAMQNSKDEVFGFKHGSKISAEWCDKIIHMCYGYGDLGGSWFFLEELLEQINKGELKVLSFNEYQALMKAKENK